MKTLLRNLSHLPSTIAGGILTGASVAVTLTSNPIVQQLAGANATIAKYVTGIGGTAAGLLLIFGVGPKP